MFNRLSAQLVLWFLLISLLPLTVVTWITYRKSVETLYKEQAAALTTKANRQVDQIVAFVHDSEADAAVFANLPSTVDYLQARTKARGSDAARKEFDRFARNFSTNFGYENVYLILASGEVVYTIADDKMSGVNLRDEKWADDEVARVFQRSTTILETQVSDYRINPRSGQPAAYIAVPVLNNRRLIGAVVFKIEGTNQFFTLAFEDPFHDYVGNGYKGAIVEGNDPEGAIKALSDHNTKEKPWGRYYFDEFNGRGRSVIEFKDPQ